jgi:Domain of Unknown Function with PDB structure (DUF3857)
MKNFLQFFLLLITITLQAQSANNQYNANTIPIELRKDATVVIRQFHLEHFAKSEQKAIITEHVVATLLKTGEMSEYYGTPAIFYDKLMSIKSLSAYLYDGAGNLVKQLKRSDFLDRKQIDAWVDDDRYKLLNFPRLAYPYTIEYKVEYENTQTMFIPVFAPQVDHTVAVQNATFKVTTFDDTPLRYKQINISNENKVSIDKNTYSWHLKNINAFKWPMFSATTEHYTPQIIVAPNNFWVDSYKGDMTNWRSYGKFMYELNQNRQDLLPKTADSLRKMVADCPDNTCKVERLYTYLQNTTRYFSIQLGIGGWQTIIAKEVDRKKYGDCKALSNYMIAMLDSVGIKANYALVRSKSQIQYKNFPNPFFDHVIVCVPMQNDTIWLECTSQTNAFGYLGSFTDNRMVLMVEEGGGKAIYTPKYDEKVNVIRKNSTVILDELGNATIHANNQYAGVQSEYMQRRVVEASEEARKKFIYNYLDVKHFDLKSLSYKLHKTRIPSVDERFNLTVDKLATIMGKRLMLPLNLYSIWDKVDLEETPRLYDVQADRRGFTQTDSIYFQLPAGFKMESKYAPVVLESDFGTYEMRVVPSDNKVLFYRKMILNDKVFKKERYAELNDFLRQIIKTDKSKLVLVKNE